MRRGLIAWSKSELPEAVFALRVAQAQAALATDGLDAFVTYITITRPAAASFLCGFVPYWSEGVMVLLRSGRPSLVVALAKCVVGWIEQTASVDAVVHTPHFAAEAAKRIADVTPRARIGVLELDRVPTGTVGALRDQGATLVDATPLYERLRSVADPPEIALCGRAAEIARFALASVAVDAADAHAVFAAVERGARLAGAEDVFVAIAPDLAQSATFLRAPIAAPALSTTFAIRLTLAYKGYWIRCVRTVARAPGDLADLRDVNERFAAAVARLPATETFASFDEWLIEGTPHSQPLEALAGTFVGRPRAALEGKVISVTAVVTVGERRYAVGGPVVVGNLECPSALLATPLG